MRRRLEEQLRRQQEQQEQAEQQAQKAHEQQAQAQEQPPRPPSAVEGEQVQESARRVLDRAAEARRLSDVWQVGSRQIEGLGQGCLKVSGHSRWQWWVLAHMIAPKHTHAQWCKRT